MSTASRGDDSGVPLEIPTTTRKLSAPGNKAFAAESSAFVFLHGWRLRGKTVVEKSELNIEVRMPPRERRWQQLGNEQRTVNPQARSLLHLDVRPR